MEETLHGGGQDASENSAASQGARSRASTYATAAQVQHHAPISVCIPKRTLSLWGILFVGAGLIAGIELLYAKIFLNVSEELQSSLTALDVTARGSLASWFSAVVLCSSALGSLLVYLIRRHRMDDYRGRYRWWLWLAPLLLIVSVNAGTGLHHALSGLLTTLSGAEIAVGGKGWWLLAYGAVFLPVAVQLAVELWRSRLATMYLWASLVAYGVAAAFELQAVRCATVLATTITHSSLLLAAHFGVLLSVLAFGRFVYLEAHDSLPEKKKWGPKLIRKRKPKPEVESQDDDVEADEENDKTARVRVDGSHAQFSQQAAAPKVTLTAAARDASSESDRKLSKAERKRLRREVHR
jgi:hypothetical protein